MKSQSKFGFGFLLFLISGAQNRCHSTGNTYAIDDDTASWNSVYTLTLAADGCDSWKNYGLPNPPLREGERFIRKSDGDGQFKRYRWITCSRTGKPTPKQSLRRKDVAGDTLGYFYCL